MQPEHQVTCADCHRDFPTTATKVSYCPKCRASHYTKTHPKQSFACRYPPCGKLFDSSMPWAGYCSNSHRVLDFKRRVFEEQDRQLKETAQIAQDLLTGSRLSENNPNSPFYKDPAKQEAEKCLQIPQQTNP